MAEGSTGDSGGSLGLAHILCSTGTPASAAGRRCVGEPSARPDLERTPRGLIWTPVPKAQLHSSHVGSQQSVDILLVQLVAGGGLRQGGLAGAQRQSRLAFIVLFPQSHLLTRTSSPSCPWPELSMGAVTWLTQSPAFPWQGPQEAGFCWRHSLCGWGGFVVC